MDFLLKEKYNSNYLKFLDNNINFKSLTDDSIFKSIMFKNIDIFKRFLVEFLKIEKNYEEVSIILIDKELIKDKINEHGKVVDFNIIIDNNIILDIELNKSLYSIVKRRNNMYLDKLDIMGFEVGKKYSLLNNKNIFQLNININPKERKKILDREITLYDIKNKEVMDKNKKIFVRNLVNYKRLYYNKSIKNNYENLFLVALTSNSYTELYNIMSNILKREELVKFMDNVIDTIYIPFSLHEWEKDKWDKYILEEERKQELREKKKMFDRVRRMGLRDGREEGIKEGIEEGIVAGRTENMIEIIKSMLKNDLSYDVISKVTNKTIDEIKDIEKNI